MKIVENRKNLLDDFVRLNEQWIKKYFEIEEKDKKLAQNPGKIIDDGGFVFSLLDNDIVVGVVALLNKNDGIFELSKIAVSPKYQGNGYANILVKTCISKLIKIKAKKVYLVSNTKLTPAIGLFKKHGFKIISHGEYAVYKRSNITMERIFSNKF